VVAAKRSVARAEARLVEAKKVLEATKGYSTAYGSSVGRWVRLSRRVNWPWNQFGTLMFVLNRESNGDPTASNGDVYLGLMQIWRAHVSDPYRLYEPGYNLKTGLNLYKGSGWSPWGM
jgi:soluble lytic murein transglycosylase-like protein